MKVLLMSLFLIGLSFGHDYNEKTPAKLSCNCGWRNKKRIIGGTKVGKNEYPWMAAILHYRGTDLAHECGGTIITPWHVITGAQCTLNKPANNVIVCVGANDANTCGESESESKNIEVEEIYYKDFDQTNLTNDISLILTKTIIKITQSVGPACFPATLMASSLNEETLKMMGWGFGGEFDDYGDDKLTELSELDVGVVPWDTCREKYPTLDTQKTQICSQSSKGDACGSDGGNPLVWFDTEVDSYTVVGIVSYREEDVCKIHQDPLVNTNVSSFRSWILDKIKSKAGAVVCSKE